MDKIKSFVMYADFRETLEAMPVEEVGQLMLAVFRYMDLGEETENLPISADLIFGIMRRQLDRDREKYILAIERKALAGKKGAEARWGKKAAQSPAPVSSYGIDPDMMDRLRNYV